MRAFGHGSMQVTAYGSDGAQCKVDPNVASESIVVLCAGPNGSPVDSYFTALLGS